jgi:hypothetical protein
MKSKLIAEIILIISLIFIQSCQLKTLNAEQRVVVEHSIPVETFDPIGFRENKLLYIDSTSLQVVELETTSNNNTVLFESALPIYSIGCNSDCIFACDDSLIYKYEYNTKQLVVFPNPKIALIGNEKFCTRDPVTRSRIQPINSGKLLIRIYPYEISRYNLDFYRKPILAVLNLETNSINQIEAYYSHKHFHSFYGALDHVFYGSTSDGVFYADQISGELRFGEFAESPDFKSINIEDPRLNPVSLDSASNSDINLVFNHLDNSSYVKLFLFNHLNNHYYRIIVRESIEDDLNKKESDLLNKYVVQEFDSSLGLTGEVVLDGKFNIYRTIIDSRGLLINYPSENPNGKNKYAYRLIQSL